MVNPTLKLIKKGISLVTCFKISSLVLAALTLCQLHVQKMCQAVGVKVGASDNFATTI